MEGCHSVTIKGLESVAGTFVHCLFFFFWPFHCRSFKHEPHVLLTVVTSCTGLTELQHLNINSCYFVDSSFQKLEGQSF
jgi:hypothetical protein